MKGTAVHGDDVLDTAEYVRPSEVSPEQMLKYNQGSLTSWTLSASLCRQTRINLLINSMFVAFPSQGGDVISTILRREVTYDQRQGKCAEVRGQQKLPQQ